MSDPLSKEEIQTLLDNSPFISFMNLKVECLCPDLAFFVGCCATPHPALLPATSLLPLAAGRGAGCGRPSA